MATAGGGPGVGEDFASAAAEEGRGEAVRAVSVEAVVAVPMPSMEDFYRFGEDLKRVQGALKGTLVHEPRAYVSEGDLLRAVRGHNAILLETALAQGRRDAEFAAFVAESQKLNESFVTSQNFAAEQAALVGEALGRIDAAEAALASLRTQVDDLCALDDVVRTQGDCLKAHDGLIAGVRAGVDAATQRTEALGAATAKLQKRHVTLERTVARLPEELQIPAANIFLPPDLVVSKRDVDDLRWEEAEEHPTQPGDDEATKPTEEEEEADALSGDNDSSSDAAGDDSDKPEDEASKKERHGLPHLLGFVKTMLARQANVVGAATETLKSQALELSEKANREVEALAAAHDAHLVHIRSQLERVDLPTLARAQVLADDGLADLRELMKYKVGYDDVDFKIEARYGEVLAYLEEALRTQEHDDDDVRRDAADLRKTLADLAHAKADRGEVASLHAQLVAAGHDVSVESMRKELQQRPLRNEVDAKVAHLVTAEALDVKLKQLTQALNVLLRGGGTTKKNSPGFAGPGPSVEHTMMMGDDDAVSSTGLLLMSRSSLGLGHPAHPAHHAKGPSKALLTPLSAHHSKYQLRPDSAPGQCMSCETPLINVAARAEPAPPVHVTLGRDLRPQRVVGHQPASMLAIDAIPVPATLERHLGHAGTASLPSIPRNDGEPAASVRTSSSPSSNPVQISIPGARTSSPLDGQSQSVPGLIPTKNK